MMSHLPKHALHCDKCCVTHECYNSGCVRQGIKCKVAIICCVYCTELQPSCIGYPYYPIDDEEQTDSNDNEEPWDSQTPNQQLKKKHKTGEF